MVSPAGPWTIIKGSPIEACPLDLVPASLFKACLPALLPTLTAIVNLSFQTGAIPSSLKVVQLSPIIKKANLDPESLANYLPISNLNYVSKLVEHAVTSQLSAYLTEKDLFEPHQSAYRPRHSTETALISVMDDLLRALDNCRPILLSLLDCSVAFDLVSHQIFLDRMGQGLGVSRPTLMWFKSYLTDRSQCVSINTNKSAPSPLSCGVPQGSVLGLILFTIYTLPLEDIIHSHNAGFHLYADDSQQYLACDDTKA